MEDCRHAQKHGHGSVGTGGVYEHWAFFNEDLKEIPAERHGRSSTCPNLYVAMYQSEQGVYMNIGLSSARQHLRSDRRTAQFQTKKFAQESFGPESGLLLPPWGGFKPGPFVGTEALESPAESEEC